MPESNTLAYIEKIHSTQSGIEDKIYKDEKSNRYIGLESGHLQKIPKIEGEVTGDLKTSLINGIAQYTRDDIINSIDKVKISLNDTTADYLLTKLVAGTNITLTENNDGVNETLTISDTTTVGHVIREEGVDLTQRANLNFIGSAITATDNAGTNSTDVTVVIPADFITSVTDTASIDLTVAAGALSAVILPAGIDHGTLADLLTDDHTQYALLAGRSGQQLISMLRPVAGTVTANTAPIKLTSGTLNTVSEIGAIEFLADDFYLGINTPSSPTYTSQYPLAQSDTYVKATTKFSTSYWPYFTTDPLKSLTGTFIGQQWISENTVFTNQRFHIDLGSAKIITRVYYENMHDSGAQTASGAKNFTFWGSNSASDFADLVYANDGTWTQITMGATLFDQHIGANQADPKYILATNGTAYRYYAFKIADSWGAGNYMGIRRIELQTTNPGNVRKGIILNDGSNLISGRVPFATTNGRLIDSADFIFSVDKLTVPKIAATIFDGDMTVTDGKGFIFGTTSGTKFGSAINQKLAFYNATPIVQGAGVADATGGVTIDAEARTAINALISRIEATGLIATI